ncbi:MAG: hypothetical protein K5666_04265 [Bacilli bacterium]|nr:hypothetical protein [Bacilli bacterium]
MNIITANVNKAIMDRLEIEVIKRVDGQFELRELLSKFVNLYFNKLILDITSLKNYEDVNTILNLAKAIDPSRIIILLDDNPAANSKLYLSTLVKNGIYNFTRNYEGITYLYEHPATLNDVQYLLLSQEAEEAEIKREQEIQTRQNPEPGVHRHLGKRFILGISNLTNHAGATTLTNMLVSRLVNKGYNAYGFEMFKQDLIFYHDEERFKSILSKLELETELRKYENADCIIIDLNDFSEADKYCDATLYLVEPSYIMLTKLMKKNKNAFLDHKEDYIVLNKSFINEQEIPDFAYESKVDIFANIPPLNDRLEESYEIDDLLRKIGFGI